MLYQMPPNKSPEPTPVGAGRSASGSTRRVGGGSAFYVRALILQLSRARVAATAPVRRTRLAVRSQDRRITEMILIARE
jgi:hypothetical protein